jgi:hypothetical protein
LGWARAEAQSVHALATADMVRLAVRTAYDSQTLVDWVDQALLHIHTKELWLGGFNAIGIRSATDLLDACRADTPNSPEQPEKVDPHKIALVVNAFNAAQRFSVGPDDPRLESYVAADSLDAAGGQLETAAATVSTLCGNLDETSLTDPGKKTLDDALSELAKAVTATRETATALEGELKKAGLSRSLKLLDAQKTAKRLAADTTASDRAKQAVSAVDDAAHAEVVDRPARLQAAKTAIRAAVKAATDHRAAVGPAALEAMQAVLPQTLTAEILGVMLVSLTSSPNIHHIRHYWDLRPTPPKPVDPRPRPRSHPRRWTCHRRWCR